MSNKSPLSEEEKEKLIRIVSEHAKHQTREKSFEAFLEYLQKELEKIFPASTIKIKKILDYEHRQSDMPMANPGGEWISYIVKLCFEEVRTNFVLGIIPHRNYRPLFDIDPQPQGNTLTCTVYAKEIFPVIECALKTHAPSLQIETLVIQKAFESGALSLTSSGGELSEITEGGELALPETEKRGP
jgi:hypothetical protein